MKKTVYVCGEDGFSSECEIVRGGKMLLVCKTDDDAVGIDFVSMVEITGDMAETFVKGSSARPDTVELLEELVAVSRKYLDVMYKGKGVI